MKRNFYDWTQRFVERGLEVGGLKIDQFVTQAAPYVSDNFATIDATITGKRIKRVTNFGHFADEAGAQKFTRKQFAKLAKPLIRSSKVFDPPNGSLILKK